MQSFPHCPATSAPLELGKSKIATLAPWLAKRSAVPFPNPDPAPVTSATSP